MIRFSPTAFPPIAAALALVACNQHPPTAPAATRPAAAPAPTASPTAPPRVPRPRITETPRADTPRTR